MVDGEQQQRRARGAGRVAVPVAALVAVVIALACALACALVIACGPMGVAIVAVAVVAGAVGVAAWRPTWAVIVLLVGLPLHTMLMALLYHVTGSVLLVKVLQPWKEAVVVVALASAAWHASRDGHLRQRLRFTLLDGMIACFVLLCLVWVIIPQPALSLSERLAGLRALMVPFGAYALGRLVCPSRRFFIAIVSVLTGEVLVFGLAAIGERALWGDHLLLAIGYGAYLSRFLGLRFDSLANLPYTFYMQGWYPRAGSLLLGPLDLSELLMVALPVVLAAFGFAVVRRARLRAWVLAVAACAGGAALILAWGRASLVLLALGLLVLTWRIRLRRIWPGLLALGAGMALGGVLLLLVVSFIAPQRTAAARVSLADQSLYTLVTRDASLSHGTPISLASNMTSADDVLTSSTSADNGSTQGHLQALIGLGHFVAEHPLGAGIGSAGLPNTRFPGAVATEDSYLVVAAQVGVLGGALYIAIFVTALALCWRAARARLDPWRRVVLFGLALSWVLIFVNGFIAQVTTNLFIMFLLWLVSGMAVTLIGRAGGRAVARNPREDTWAAVRPLKIAMDANCLRTARTGVRTYADELIARFTRPDAPHRVVVLRGPIRLSSRVRIFRMLNQVVYLGWLHLWLPLRLWLGGYDALFSPEYLTPVWSPVATIVMFHDALFLRRPQDYNHLWLAMFRRVTLPAIRRADAVLVPSTYTARETAEYGGVDPERIYVVAEGGPTHGEALTVDMQSAREALARFGVRPRQYVLHVGVLERRKNLPMLIRAFAAWRARSEAGQQMKLVLAGQPGPRPDLDDARTIAQTIRDLGLEDAVVLTGHVSAEERDALYVAAAMVAIPSTFEGFGIPVLEAFAARVPVLCARATSLPEVAGDAALLFDPANPAEIAAALDRVAGDSALRERMVRAGTERLRHFTWERAAEGTFAAFEEAVVHRYAPRGSRPQSGAFTLASEPVASVARDHAEE